MPRLVAAPLRAVALAVVLIAPGCADQTTSESDARASSGPRPSILLVTLDTTRADAIGPDALGVSTPAFNALAAQGRRFTQAYATAPETLPSHTSMMTGLYPGGHGVHENARYLPAAHAVLAERLQQAGYRTTAVVSSFVLSRRFGLARGFDVYDDEMPDGDAERTAAETTTRAIAYLSDAADQPRLLWVHYFDPHAPYAPPEEYLNQYAERPYLGEIAAMDRQLGRLVQAFEQSVPEPRAIVVAGDHGEGLGDHGELQHGNLLYQSTMHVPLVVAGPGITPGVDDTPVSTRRVFHTVLDWAGLASADSLRDANDSELVLGEAMRPFLGYGWQPQIMAIDGRQKAIYAGRLEVYDVLIDPGETHDIAAAADVSSGIRDALDAYPVPSPDAARAPDDLGDEARRNLASLGYVSASVPPTVRRDAPRPVDMVGLFDVLERASGLFVEERYAEVIPLLERILADDAYNLDAALRLASAHSVLGHQREAEDAFRRAAEIAPRSTDVRLYLALHYARGPAWERAVPLLERIVADMPERLPAIEALAVVRERQGRLDEAIELRQRIYGMREATPAESVQLGRLAMSVQQTELAIQSFDRARRLQRDAFGHHLELGVLYLAARRYQDARAALDRVSASHPEYPMALFKRAQVSVLLNEPDRAARIARARAEANVITRPLIDSERLFEGIPPR